MVSCRETNPNLENKIIAAQLSGHHLQLPLVDIGLQATERGIWTVFIRGG